MTNEEKLFIILRARQYMDRCNEMSATFKEYDDALVSTLNKCVEAIEAVNVLREQIRVSTDIVLEIGTQMRDLIERVEKVEDDDADWWKHQ